jgi:outer membrane immunogenic protein
MRHLIWTISAAAIVATGSAFAADLGHAPPPAPLPPPVPVFTWTGFYIGAQGGYAFGSSAEAYRLAPNSATFIGTQTYDVNGGIFGGVVGANYQMGAVVVGLEAEENWASVSGASGVINVGPPNKGDTYTTHLTWYGAVKGRLGYAVDRTLFYVDGGAAFGGVKHAYLAALNGGAGNTFFQSGNRSGYIVGGGLEYAFTEYLTGKIEYDYVNLGNSSIFYSAPPTTNYSIWKDHYNIIKAALNWKFGWGAPPAPAVAARY